jgi:pyrroloquinoline quinone biosynthesis protein B
MNEPENYQKLAHRVKIANRPMGEASLNPCGDEAGVELVILGIAQDAGAPHIGCRKSCCRDLWEDPRPWVMVTCLGLIDRKTGEQFLLDCTPDFPRQWSLLDKIFRAPALPLTAQPSELSATIPTGPLGLNGIFLTHAHIGHYTGLMYLGKEGMGSRNLPVYVMPLMERFLRTNAPWDQLVGLKNIFLQPMTADHPVALDRINVTPFLVPHRNEYSETVGFLIAGPSKTAAFIPDIDRWQDWERDLPDLLSRVDFAFLDGTFFGDGELPGRDMSEIPHPQIIETMRRLEQLAANERNKVYFIHLNHTNPCLRPDSPETALVHEQGMQIASQGSRFYL